jgi:ketosteroid isomerase-like protein
MIPQRSRRGAGFDRSIIIATAVVVAVLARCAVADPPPPTTDAPASPTAPQADPAFGTEAQKEQIRALKAVYERAVAEQNPDLLAPHLGEDFSGVMVTGDGVNNVADLRAYWAKIQGLLGEGGKYTVELLPDNSLVFGDTAVSRGTTREVAVTGAGKRYEFASQWTAVSRQSPDGAWRLVRVHGSMDPVGNVFVKTFLSRTAWTAGAIGAAVGLLLGVAVALLIRRCRHATGPGPTSAARPPAA